jgi:hypothetical protein
MIKITLWDEVPRNRPLWTPKQIFFLTRSTKEASLLDPVRNLNSSDILVMDLSMPAKVNTPRCHDPPRRLTWVLI